MKLLDFLEFGKLYQMAICPTRNAVAPVLEVKQSGAQDGIGFWRCPICLEWHAYLEPERTDDSPGADH